MATSSYANMFGTTGAGAQGSKAGISTAYGQQAKPKPKATAVPQEQKTFAELQKAGVARPAPVAQAPQPAPAPMVRQLQQQLPATQPTVQTAQANPYQGLLTQLQSQIQKQFTQPSGYTAPEFQQLRQSQMANLQAEYGAQRQALDEELARRGLSSSSIGAGRMGDLAGQQARAMAGLEAQLLQQQAEMGQRGRETALSTLAQVTGQVGQQSLGQQEVGLRAQQMKQQEEQFYKSLGAEEQRFVRTLAEQQAGRLQQLGISTRQLDLDAARIRQEGELQGRSLNLQQARDLAEIDYRAKSLQQEAALRGRSMDIEEARNQATLGLQRDQMALDETFRREGFAIDRERIGQAESQFTRGLELDQRRQAQAEEQFNRQFGFTQQQADQALGLQLAEILSKSTDPNAAAAIQPFLQQLMARLNPAQAQAAAAQQQATRTATATAPVGTTAPATQAPAARTAAQGVNTNVDITQPLDFSEILRFAQAYGPQGNNYNVR